MALVKFNYLFFFSLLYTLGINAQTLDLSGSGYDMHSEINWNTIPSADRFEIWRRSDSTSNFTLLATTRNLRWIDWTGRTDQLDHDYQYYIDALSVIGHVLSISDTIVITISPFSDDQFLDMVQEYTFRYFWEYAHPISGMARERLGSDDIVTTGGTGFGVMSIVAGVHRGFITRQQGVDRLLQLVSFLQIAERFHGVFPHWMNGRTGAVHPFSTFDNGGDLVETAFLMEGLLTARGYFDQDNEKENVLREVITSLWEDVEWDFYSRDNSGVLYWHWSPQYAWKMNFPIRGYNEALIVYLLAIASPTHPVAPSYWQSGWAGAGYVSGFKWFGIKLLVGPPLGGPLFFAHYSYQGFDPRNIKDQYANYFIQNTNHTLINRAYCIANPLHHTGYNDQCWGLTASDDPFGYEAHAPGGTTDNGTITPAAALPSMPYTPEESKKVMRHLYQQYGEHLWGPYGFYDAFNPGENWFADSYIAIDEGPIINMIENYRSGILWSNFMSNPEITPALSAIGFVADIVATDDQQIKKINWSVYPTSGDGNLYIKLDEKSYASLTIRVVDNLGRNIPFHQSKSSIGDDLIALKVDSNFSGWAWVAITDNFHFNATKPVWIN
ncbi:MAG: glucoamylase family protein [Saprospiraceae bacterium]